MLRVMSFNIRHGLAEDGANHWAYRQALVRDRVEAFDPDLLGLQECRDDAQAGYLKSQLPAYEFVGVRRGGSGETALEMAPLFFRKEVFQARATGHFWLSETPSKAGSRSWDSAFARTASWVELVHQPTGRALTFLNTHFDYQPSAIAESARLLKDWAAPHVRQGPLIVSGDFNADKQSAAYRQLTADQGLRDVFRLARPTSADEGTFHGYGQLSPAPAIDWLLVSKHFTVAAAEVDRYHAGALYPSDHFPVTAVLAWPAYAAASETAQPAA